MGFTLPCALRKASQIQCYDDAMVLCFLKLQALQILWELVPMLDSNRIRMVAIYAAMPNSSGQSDAAGRMAACFCYRSSATEEVGQDDPEWKNLSNT